MSPLIGQACREICHGRIPVGKMVEIGQACCEDNIGSWLVENCHLQIRAVIWCGC